MKKMYKKSIVIKNFDKEEGVFEGIASTDSLDRHGEIISLEALKNVAENQDNVPLFFGHSGDRDKKDILGRMDILGVEDNGLKVKGTLAKNHPDFAFIHELLTMGALTKMSVGFLTNTEGIKKNDAGALVHNDIELVEVSLVPVPANNEATITSAKELGDESQREEVMKVEDNQAIMDLLNEINSKLDGIIENNAEKQAIDEEEEAVKELKALLGAEKK